MNAVKRWMLALILGGIVVGFAGVVAQPAPVSATLPPGWAPGTTYANIFGADNLNPLPSTGPVSRASRQTLRPAPPSYHTDGQYCSDATGGTVFVPAGAPTDALTCPAQDSGS